MRRPSLRQFEQFGIEARLRLATYRAPFVFSLATAVAEGALADTPRKFRRYRADNANANRELVYLRFASRSRANIYRVDYTQAGQELRVRARAGNPTIRLTIITLN